MTKKTKQGHDLVKRITLSVCFYQNVNLNNLAYLHLSGNIQA